MCFSCIFLVGGNAQERSKTMVLFVYAKGGIGFWWVFYRPDFNCLALCRREHIQHFKYADRNVYKKHRYRRNFIKIECFRLEIDQKSCFWKTRNVHIISKKIKFQGVFKCSLRTKIMKNMKFREFWWFLVFLWFSWISFGIIDRNCVHFTKFQKISSIFLILKILVYFSWSFNDMQMKNSKWWVLI